MTRQTVVIALGANLPWQGQSPEQTLFDAAASLKRSGLLQGLRLSRLWRSAPVNALGPEFVNAALVAESDRSPDDLLALLLDTELAFGRDRRAHDHMAGVSPARTLDLDLIAVGDLRCQTADLTLPHPRATQRAFVLEPLAELLPSFGLRDALGDQASVATWLSRLSSSDREQLHPVE
jgi:2-amino-4-hydroxy-6-hydroxymethyldihydropteridine diphosphokinase